MILLHFLAQPRAELNDAGQTFVSCKLPAPSPPHGCSCTGTLLASTGDRPRSQNPEAAPGERGESCVPYPRLSAACCPAAARRTRPPAPAAVMPCPLPAREHVWQLGPWPGAWSSQPASCWLLVFRAEGLLQPLKKTLWVTTSCSSWLLS